MYYAKMQSIGYLDRKVGEKVGKFNKCMQGCLLVLFILICIFGPLILFSTLNPSTKSNLIIGGHYQI